MKKTMWVSMLLILVIVIPGIAGARLWENPTTQNVNTGSIDGVISDASTGNPIAGAIVSASGMHSWGLAHRARYYSSYAITDSSGNYILNGLSAGSTIVHAYKSGYTGGKGTVVVVANDTVTEDIALVPVTPPSTGSIEGTVTDASTGTPIVGAEVEVSGNTYARWYGGSNSAHTDSTGHYILTGVSAGSTNLEVEADGYSEVNESVNIPANDTATQDVSLVPSTPPPTGVIVGTVTDASTGNPLAGAKVYVHSGVTQWGWNRCRTNFVFTTTDSNGNYSLYSVSTGTLYVYAYDSGYERGAESAIVLANSTTTVNFGLSVDNDDTTVETVMVNQPADWQVQIAECGATNVDSKWLVAECDVKYAEYGS